MKDPKKLQNLPKIKEIIMNRNVYLYFLPSPHLKTLVAKGEDPMIKDMPDVRKTEILSGNGIMVQKLMVWKWIEGTLDKKRSFILSNGEIRVVDSTWKLQDKII